MMETPQNGRSGLSVTFDIKTIVTVLTVLSPLLVGASFVLQLRQDVRQNASVIAQQRVELSELRTMVEDVQRARLIYCAGVRRDTSRSLPDAAC
jgi:cell division protein FtsL